MNTKLKIAIDFDGTVVSWSNFPYVGKDIGAVPILKELVNKGHELYLWTVRDDCLIDGFPQITALQAAIDWFISNDIPLNGVNKIEDQITYSKSPKMNYDLVIDDKGFNIPLKIDTETNNMYVNWNVMNIMLRQKGII